MSDDDLMPDDFLEDELDEDGGEASEEFIQHQEITVDPGQSPIRIDKFLIDRTNGVSRNRIQQALKAGAITVDGKEVKSNLKVKPGMKILMVIPRPPGAGQGLVPENIPLDIVYEDEHLLVLNKPAGLVVHPGVGNWSGTLVNALAYYFQQQDLPILDGNESDRIGLVHRIDKNTSGLLVVGKTEFALSKLAKQFFNHTIDRSYLAIVWGQPNEMSGTIDVNVGRHPRLRTLQQAFPDGDEGKHAITHYEVLEGMYYTSLVSCKLETGRTHQIRIHMKHLGHPLFNDDRYGGDRIVKGTVYSKYKQFVLNTFQVMPRHALHAFSLGFEHPATGERMYFEAEPPEDFKQCLDRWRHYVNTRRNMPMPEAQEGEEWED
jgi:23S rRNA pseudouridine1911/1915/1917 synthase